MQAEPAIVPTRWGECEIRGPVHLFRERLLMRLFACCLSGGRVLDAGCGSGTLALDLCRTGYTVTGVEDSADFVQLVQQSARHLGLGDRLTVQRGSVTRLDFPAGHFDGVVCGEVLEHVVPADGGDRAVIAEFRRVLRPGGICAISAPLGPGQWDCTDAWARHVKRYAGNELQDLLVTAGFSLVRVRYWGFPLGRLYHKLLFAPWVRRTAGQSLAQREARPDTRAGRHLLLVQAMAVVLRFDELFGRWPWGRGVVVVAAKPS